MIGAVIGSALGVAAQIYGGLEAAKASKKAAKIAEDSHRRKLAMLEQRGNDNESWYNRNYYGDATQRADAQRILTQTAEQIRERNRAAAGAAAVGGGTEESVAATKAANAKAMADATSRIAAAGEARKDEIDSQYNSRKDAIADARLAEEGSYAKELGNIERERAKTIAGATATAGTLLGNAGAAWDEYK